MSDVISRLKCDWCGGTNMPEALSCRNCGAPINEKTWLVNQDGEKLRVLRI